MSLPYFTQTPRTEQSTLRHSRLSARFSSIHDNVRSMLGGNGSSVYSSSPLLAVSDDSPKLPELRFMQRSTTSLTLPHTEPGSVPEDIGDRAPTLQPLRPQHTAGSYQRAITQQLPVPAFSSPILRPDPAQRRPSAAERQYADPDTEELASMVNDRRQRRRRVKLPPRTKARSGRAGAWVRRRTDRGRLCGFVKKGPARTKLISCIVSAVFLILILVIYLCIVVMRPNVGQEVHVLFILVIICTTIFFCHALVRLCMITLRPPQQTPRIPEITFAEGFQPIHPIPVHLARDEELADQIDEGGHDLTEESKEIKVPPPAYGLWRCSVRVDPNLLHWQRVQNADSPTDSPQSPLGPQPWSLRRASDTESQITTFPPTQPTGPRPPSYASDDGITYVMQAVPRSMAPAPGVVEVHPAFRHPADRPYNPQNNET